MTISSLYTFTPYHQTTSKSLKVSSLRNPSTPYQNLSNGTMPSNWCLIKRFPLARFIHWLHLNRKSWISFWKRTWKQDGSVCLSLWWPPLLMRRPSLCTQKFIFILFLVVESHYRTSTTRHQYTTAWLWHTAVQYGKLQSSTLIKTLFIIILKIAITEGKNHGIPAVWCMEIALHPISPHDQHLSLLSSLPIITRSIIHNAIHSFQQLSYNMKAHNHS